MWQGNAAIRGVLLVGKANLSRAAIEQGFKGVSLDSSSNPNHNVLEGQGLRLWLLALTVQCQVH